MSKLMRNWLTAGLLGLLVACGGGGGGDRATGVEPGPEPPGQPVDPDPPVIPSPNPAPYAEAEELIALITRVSIPEDGRAIIDFRLSDGDNTAILDLQPSNVRFTLAKLQSSPLGNLTGSWQSYNTDVEDPTPGVGPETDLRLQAEYERPSDDSPDWQNNEDGTYRYRMNLDVNNPPNQDQAELEGIDLNFEPGRTHRVSMQFDGNPNTTANPFYDWEPASGSTSKIFTMDIAATANCNRCHDPLAVHGPNRREIQYCVTCHNPGTTDANSGNTVDMKVMIHKIHRGKNLPTVKAGGEYAIWGFRDSKHDYSHLGFPGGDDHLATCVNCHAGSATVGDREDLVVTSQGDNWNEVPSAAACGSCHDGVSDKGFDAPAHMEGRDDSSCFSCHSEPGVAGSIAASHRVLTWEAAERFITSIENVTNTSPGEKAMVTFRISDPSTGEDWDIKSDPAFNNPDASRLAVAVAWDTRDFTNTGNGPSANNASSVQTQDIASFTDNGDGSFTATMPEPIPDEAVYPGIAASGSGAAVVEGHPALDVDPDLEGDEEIPLTNEDAYFSIDEADGQPVPRREQVELDKCLACHGKLSLHGGNRTDSIESCVTCHNPRNTDRSVRELEEPWCDKPPTDGKGEESLDFKTMVHAIHAPGMRENPLQIVGFRCFTTHVYDEEHVHYPGDLANCTACHTDQGYYLPLQEGVLGTTVNTGDDRKDPSDDLVVTPISAVCSSCHDGVSDEGFDAPAHMEFYGGDFATTQAAIDSGEAREECNSCHRVGSSVLDVSEVHKPR
jgi:OmcA/MtrC family decaheme c-type cytochrome